MSKLLAEGFRRLFKGVRFYVVLALTVFIPAFVTIFVYIVDGKGSGVGDYMLFFLTGTMTMFISITAGMFIVNDFKNNTIRNKIIVGHSRTSIYLANLIISLFVAIVYQLAYWLTLIGLGKLFDEFRLFPCKDVYTDMLITMVIIFTFTSAIVFVCNSMRNIGGFVLSLLMDTIISSVAGIIVMFSRSDKVEKIASIAIPSLQRDAFRYAPDNVPENAIIMIIIDIAIFIAATIGGIMVFNRTDLK